MERQTRDELKRLSEKLLGSGSKWQKLQEVSVETDEKVNGRPIKKVIYRTGEQILEELKKIEAEISAQQAAEKVQKEAAGKA